MGRCSVVIWLGILYYTEASFGPTIQSSRYNAKKNGTEGKSLTYQWIIDDIEGEISFMLYRINTPNTTTVMAYSKVGNIKSNTTHHSKRYHLKYSYLGQNNRGEEQAMIKLTINDLRFEDDGDIYTLQVMFGNYTVYENVTLNVFAHPRTHGLDLQFHHQIKSGEPFDVTWHLSGKPKPKVRWKFGGIDIEGRSREISRNTFAYTVTIPSMKQCETKILTVIAKGFLSLPLKRFFVISATFDPSKFQPLNTITIDKIGSCTMITWKDNNDILCDIEYELKFFNGSSPAHLVTTVNSGSSTIYRNCKIPELKVLKEIKIISFVYKRYPNGTRILLATNETEPKHYSRTTREGDCKANVWELKTTIIIIVLVALLCGSLFGIIVLKCKSKISKNLNSQILENPYVMNGKESGSSNEDYINMDQLKILKKVNEPPLDDNTECQAVRTREKHRSKEIIYEVNDHYQ